MDFDQGLKIATWIVLTVLGLVGVWFSTRQFTLGAKAANREEYKFAKSFFEDIKQNADMHPFARQKGYQAIAGSQSLPAPVIEHLMSLTDPVVALQDYVISKSYLKHVPGTSKRQLDFSGSPFATHERRQAWSLVYAAGFVVAYLVAVTPIIFWMIDKISSSVAIALMTTIFPVSMYVAITLAREVRQIRAGMRLIQAQNEQADREDAAAQP
ncbi:hypothetical protein [Rugamonas rubra]|uniref:Uncharacterized protein n=1 Tax=Rugamonas rubra TaxID=758825 RepID=A0A1I4SI59_9BURK|nr:hypothetical protein [Rugamonas rubra]SFM63983.1 hypothetical protein SAMN02982985_04784 [Rugamonas rubra]